ncbi:MAG: 4-(cytidine 5'-diphospho)-2-C-methyl-D-erythritol kinase [Verrucomicrobia bacterium]|jgi:4-diphosphocytidyl-2-C-methyl-D-erythritol kinase|nr:4-(cytidine 5'-diphospho)-2-C-methyl-D-erythritol kinase [Verrucomicrobiota bacterium]
MTSLAVESPAKINLMLAVHGPRPDGFHALTSIMAPLTFGDRLQVSLSEAEADSLRCDDPEVPTGSDNLILRAAQLFRGASGVRESFDFYLEKRIPMGAGLGGGSSNAAVALKAMNELVGEPLDRQALLGIAADLGSDCPFFIDAKSARVSGRGEIISVLPKPIRERLSGQRIALFRPHFGVPTAWAYACLRANGPESYENEASARGRIEAFLSGGPLSDLLFNSFESSVGQKYLVIPCLLEALRGSGVACLLSGSGSCCFALLEGGTDLAALRSLCERAFGPQSFFIESWLA